MSANTIAPRVFIVAHFLDWQLQATAHATRALAEARACELFREYLSEIGETIPDSIANNYAALGAYASECGALDGALIDIAESSYDRE